ncbi:hypothetical protein [Paenibacillus sp. y28]|uniref:hypothetical protein n=1 Tax=Paenibacillus sp. y28 TaxID=3129110 RepID=UPI00301A3DC2
MKKKSLTSRFGIAAVALATMFSSLTVTGAAAAESSRTVYYSVQSNTVCGNLNTNQQYRDKLVFNINNLSDVATDVTLYLYTKNGSQLTSAGIQDSGITSDITPGTQITIPANSTVSYFSLFGLSYLIQQLELRSKTNLRQDCRQLQSWSAACFWRI